jgi:Xaa-Pro aminopeptidase
VLAANEAAIAQCRPGVPFNAPHDAAISTMIEGLLTLGLLEGTVNQIIHSGAYLRFCPHKSCHWLGLDVHDVGDYRLGGEWRPLQPGMVLTVEPGIYISADATGLDDQQLSHMAQGALQNFIGTGIRIEDDVLITESGCEVLSRRVPKTADEIERLMRAV